MKKNEIMAELAEALNAAEDRLARADAELLAATRERDSLFAAYYGLKNDAGWSESSS